MPKVYRLGEHSETLQGVSLVVGDGLCSNIYVVGREEATVIDTGVGNYMNPVWPQLAELGVEPRNVKKIILTHAHHDHAMGTFLIQEKADPEVYVHEEDTRYIASRLGDRLIKVREGDVIETELWPLHIYWTPGHTSGSMSLYNSEHRILFSGDTVFPDGYYGRYDGESGSYEAIVESLKKLDALDVEALLSGHGSPVFENGNRHIEMALRSATRWA
ncbi:MBL fold metallo-hydrolase [Candidatus Bathyarchaeota archaeon]|nr:MBL fold metallo-hydrolase [Candidatus Bathyarchaeota archaeon]